MGKTSLNQLSPESQAQLRFFFFLSGPIRHDKVNFSSLCLDLGILATEEITPDTGHRFSGKNTI